MIYIIYKFYVQIVLALYVMYKCQNICIKNQDIYSNQAKPQQNNEKCKRYKFEN